MARPTALNISLYSPGKGEEPRYRRELHALLTALGAQPITRHVCVHDMLGSSKAGEYGKRVGEYHDNWFCATGQDRYKRKVRFDHAVSFVTDAGEFLSLAQPYGPLDADPLPEGIAAVKVSDHAPYHHSAEAWLVGSAPAVERLAPIARKALAAREGVA